MTKVAHGPVQRVTSGTALGSARLRIVGWMLLLLVFGLGGTIAISGRLLHLRTYELTTDQLIHAAENFRTFAKSPSGRSQDTVEDLFSHYLQGTVSSRAESAFSIVDGHPDRRSPLEPPVRLDLDEEFVKHAADARQPLHGVLETSAGPVHYAVIPVELVGDPSRGAFVQMVYPQMVGEPLFQSLRLTALVGAAALAVAAAASWVLAGRVLGPVRLIRQAAEVISESDLTRRIPVSGTDEMASLARTFNGMLDRLQTAFVMQREFIDDAGHELRTPLTVVRGHLDLFAKDPQRHAASLPLIKNEVSRMDRIVHDLILLAKAEHPDFIRVAPTNLADLTINVLAKARMLGERRWSIDALAEGVVQVDEERLTQALMQLAANAVNYTHKGDCIAVGSVVTNTELRLWVRDTGAGVRAEDAERIFDRFRRGETVRRGDGAGLGLAIVSSIAKGHGGKATLTSTPGTGASFTLAMPLRSVADGAVGVENTGDGTA